MYLIIKDAEKAKEIMKTNRPYKKGDKITGDAVMISTLAARNKDVFEVGGVEKKEVKKSPKRGDSKQRENFGPKQDKMIDKPKTKKSDS